MDEIFELQKYVHRWVFIVNSVVLILLYLLICVIVEFPYTIDYPDIRISRPGIFVMCQTLLTNPYTLGVCLFLMYWSMSTKYAKTKSANFQDEETRIGGIWRTYTIFMLCSFLIVGVFYFNSINSSMEIIIRYWKSQAVGLIGFMIITLILSMYATFWPQRKVMK